jgi:Protein kinase domain
MGEVYRARDTRLDRDVAIKVLPDAFAADADRRARFEREAKTVAALSHPNILAVYDFGADEGTAYAVMELLEGETCEASGYLSDVRVSRDGGRVAFFEHPKKFDDRGSVNVVDRAGKRRVLVDGFWGEQGLVWARDGNTIIFLRERRHTRR